MRKEDIEHTNEGKSDQLEQDDKTAQEEKEFMEACEKAIRDNEAVDLLAMNGVILGIPRVGKSSLLQRMIGKLPQRDMPSTGAAEAGVQVAL